MSGSALLIAFVVVMVVAARLFLAGERKPSIAPERESAADFRQRPRTDLGRAEATPAAKPADR